MSLKLFRNFLGIFALIYLAGCSSSVRVSGQWANEDLVPEEGYDRLLVAALLNNYEVRRVIENEVVEELDEDNIEATNGISVFSDMFSEEFSENRDEVFGKISADNHEAVLVISVLDEEVMADYIRTGSPGNPMDTYTWYGNFWNYYDYHYPTIYDPGYYTLTKHYYVEANLYDVSTEELVWTGQTESFDPVDLTSFSKLMAATVVEQMKEAAIVKPE